MYDYLDIFVMIILFEDRDSSLIKISHHLHVCDFINLRGPISDI